MNEAKIGGTSGLSKKKSQLLVYDIIFVITLDLVTMIVIIRDISCASIFDSSWNTFTTTTSHACMWE